MRPDQVFNQKNGPQPIKITVSSAFLANLDPKLQIPVVQIVGTVLASVKEQLSKNGVNIEIKEE